MTAAQVALASLDAFVILTGSGVISNLLAGWLARWWTARQADIFRPYRKAGVASRVARLGRCEHLRVREICDDCNHNQWAKDYLGPEKGA
jgi:hypothetical protein